MKNKTKVVSRGYTITVKSWENDADNYSTGSITLQSKELVKVYYDLMKLCESCNNQPEGVIYLGNTYEEFTSEQLEVLVSFLKNKPILFDDEDDLDSWENDDFIDYFGDMTRELLGSSDFLCRVCESVVVTYSEEDIYLDLIEF